MKYKKLGDFFIISVLLAWTIYPLVFMIMGTIVNYNLNNHIYLPIFVIIGWMCALVHTIFIAMVEVK
jgi:hypothetical protein